MPENETWPDLKQLDLAELQTGKILVQRKPPEETTEGGLVIPDRSQEALPVGRVVKIGPRSMRGEPAADFNKESDLRVGNVIAFFEHDAMPLPEAFGKDLLLLNENDPIFCYREEK